MPPPVRRTDSTRRMPAPTAAGRGLDQQREPDRFGLGGDRGNLVRALDRRRLEGSREPPARPTSPSQPTGMQLVPERLDRIGVRPDEDQAGVLDRRARTQPAPTRKP